MATSPQDASAATNQTTTVKQAQQIAQPPGPAPMEGLGFIGGGPNTGAWVDKTGDLWNQYQTWLGQNAAPDPTGEPNAPTQQSWNQPFSASTPWQPGTQQFGAYPTSPLSSFTPSTQGTGLQDLLGKMATAGPTGANALYGQAAQQAMPNVAGQKEAAKEGFLSGGKQLTDQAQMSAARRGTSGSGAEMALENRIGDETARNTTMANRAIDANASQVGFGNLLAAGQAQQGAHGQQFGELAQGAGLASSTNRDDFMAQLQSILSLGGLNLQGQNQNLSQWIAQQQARQGDKSLDNNLTLGQGSLDLQRILGRGSQALTGRGQDMNNNQFFANLFQNGSQFDQQFGLNSDQAFWNTILRLSGS